MRSRRGSEDDTTPVEILTDDDDWSGATAVSTESRRSRWPEVLLVAAVLAVVVGLGAAGGGDDADDATDMPRRTTTSVRRSTSSTRPRPTTTTTTWPASLAGTGPVLGAGTPVTGSALVVSEQSGDVAVLDLDTGDLCRTRVGRDAWFPVPQTVRDEVMVVDNSGRSMRVGRGCELEPGDRGAEPWQVRAVTETTYWITEDGPIQRLLERSTDDGATLRTVDIPGAGNMVADDSWLVVSAAGELVAIELRGDRQIALGSGYPLAIAAGKLFAIRCEALSCRAVTIDVETGRSRTVDGPTPGMWEPIAMAPDGSMVQYSVVSPLGQVDYVLLDLRDGFGRDVRGGPCSFTEDSRWLLCVRPSVAEAVSVEDGRIVDLTSLFHSPINGFAVLRLAPL